MIKNFQRICLTLIVCILSGMLCGCGAEDPLPSWNDASYVPVEERIATFDMDGTIVVEKKVWLELAVAVYRIQKQTGY